MGTMKYVALILVFLAVVLFGVSQLTKPEIILYTSEEVANTTKQTTLIFVGDMMFDRYIRQVTHNKNYTSVLSSIKPVLLASDGVIGNLEGPITTNPSVSIETRSPQKNHFTFTFDQAVATLLKENNFLAVSLGNNHILNFGKEGVAKTTAFLTSSNIGYFGVPSGKRSTIITSNDILFGLVAYNAFIDTSIDGAVSEIKKISPVVDWLIVYPHWGNEYEKTPSALQVNQAHAFIDAGADMVVGAHPHVIQTKELYKEKFIYYSLGNFVFDQYFNEDVRCGLLLQTTFTKINDTTMVDIEEFTTYLNTDASTVYKKCGSIVKTP